MDCACRALHLSGGRVRRRGIGNGRFIVPMRVFADLLKIPVEPPEVKLTVHSSREEDGVVIEDVSWPSIDGDIVPAFIVRPAKAAAVCPPSSVSTEPPPTGM